MKPREAAFRVVYEVLYNGGYSTIVLENMRNNCGFNNLDSAFMTNISMGTLRNSIFLEHVISEFSDIRLKKISPSVTVALKTGIYQILFMDRVPDSAACNETTIIAGRFGGNRSKGFVNGVMRSISRNREKVSDILKKLTGVERLSSEYSFSQDAVRDIISFSGKAEAEGIMAALNLPPSMCARINTEGNPEKLMDAEGIKYEKGKHAAYSYYIEPGRDIGETDIYRNGNIAVQDEGAQEMVEFLRPAKGEHILDACAAPGGKTAYMNFITKGGPDISAYDIDPDRLKRMRENLRRLNSEEVRTELKDMSAVPAQKGETFHAVLLDVPCSGLGTSQRRPEIKLNYCRKENNELIRLQARILDNAVTYLKPGGRMVYGTCTLSHEENNGQIKKFLERHPDFMLSKEKTIIPDGRRGGFYMAELVTKYD